MKKVTLILVIALGTLFNLSCNETEEIKENDQIAADISNLDTDATGKEGGSSTGDRDGDN